MSREEVIEKIKFILIDEFEVDASLLLPDASLKETLDLDSLDYVDMVVVIESTFGFKMDGEDFTTITSFQSFYDYIADKVNN